MKDQRFGRLTIARGSDLPSPEERVFKGIHTGQSKVEQPILGRLVPILPVVPECTIGVRRRVRLDALQVETAIVEAVTVFSSNSDTEGGLTGKKVMSFSTESERLLAYLSVILLFHDEQAIPGQTPPISPSGAGTLMGSVLG